MDSALDSEKVTKDNQLMYSLGYKWPIGACCLIGNKGVNTEQPLYSTRNDVDDLAAVFEHVGVKVLVREHFLEMRTEDVISILNRLKNLDQYSCFIFYYTGHGKNCGIHLDGGHTFRFKRIVDFIMSISGLLGKPKVFLFDCCRVYTDDAIKRDKCCKTEAYRDCVIGYACSSGEEAFISDDPFAKNHSIFTKALCTMLLTHHRHWPLVSVLIQASRLTQKSIENFSTQTPQVIVQLQKQLFLCFDHYVEKARILSHLADGTNSDLCRDGPPVRRRQFKTKQDVTGNLGSLGQWLKVFICYVPSTTNEGVQKLEHRVYTFARHLITYGFDVKVDLLESFTVGFDWIAWTDREMSQADWIILVCSRSSFELLHHPSGPKEIDISSQPVQKSDILDTAVNNEVSKKFCFSGKILYNRLVNDNGLKVLPVVLREEDNRLEYVLPALRDPRNILCIFEDRPFDYEKQDGHFELLVCRLAGINRTSIDQVSSENTKQFVQLPSIIPHGNDSTSYSLDQQVAQETAHSSNGISTHRHVGGAHQFPSPQYYRQHGSNQHVVHQPSLYSQTQYVSSEHYDPNVYPMQVPNFYPPSPSYGQPQHHSVSGSHTGSYYAAHQLYNPHQYALHPSSSMYNSSHASPAPLNVKGVGNRATGNLPMNKIPVDSSILLDLSQDIKEWRFLGRYLDLDENVLEEIDQYTRPNKMRDKALKVLKEWVGSAPEPTWQTLGEVLMESENMLLYEKLRELLNLNKV